MFLSNCLKKILAVGLIVGCVPVANALVVLQYHHVSTKTPKSTSISPALFKAHLEAIESSGFEVLDIRAVAELIRAGKTLPDRAAVITFDDGYRSVYDAAFPELKRRKWPFTVFINTDPHDEKNPQYMSWDELRAMHKAGAVIANHTLSHAHLIRGKYAPQAQGSESLRREEIVGAQARIKKEIGSDEKLFAYPYGEYDSQLQRLLAKEGYLGFGQQSGPVATSGSKQAIPRFPFGGPYGDIEDFKTKLRSLAFPELRTVVSSEKGKTLDEPLLPKAVKRPQLRLASPILSHIGAVTCYASGQGKIESQVKGGALLAQANKDLPAGRSRYNCTAHAGNGRYYWHSEMFIRKRDDGSWVAE